jgi:Peptidase family M23
VLALVLLVICVPASAYAQADRYTPLVMSTMSTPHWFTGTDGRVHLVYELSLTNGFPVPVTVTSVSASAGNRTIERLDGAELEASTSLMSTPTEPATTVPASSIAVVWLDIALANRRAIPRRVRHRVTVVTPAGLPVPRSITSSGGDARVDRRPPVVLGPPLRGPRWIAVGSCCDGPHRRSLQPVNGRLQLGQRFAIDWNGADAQGRWVVGDPSLNESWIFYGKPVIAVADARVVKAVDRFPNQVPNAPNPVGLRQADGNHVILDLGHGRYGFYAHLAPGSVRVKAGQRVRRGQVIGRLGNSGSASGPHLHFHVMDRPSAIASNGLPFVIDRFRLDGQIPPLDDALMETINSGQPVPVDPKGSGPRRRQLPLGREVVDFNG